MSRDESSATLPDYWSFVGAAQERIGAEFPAADLAANRLFLSLNRASNTVTYDFESSIHRPAGSTWPGFRLMLALWVRGPLNANEAATATGMSRAAVSSLSNTLVTRGLVERAQSEADRRLVTLSLSPAGLARIREDFQAQNARESEWAAGLEAEEVKTLTRLLEKLMEQRRTIGGKSRS